MTFRLIIGIIALVADAFVMFNKYKNNDLVGVIFWGILMLLVAISFH